MLILTEKPSVAAAFAGALSCPKKDGYYENNDYCIVNAVGHLLQQYEPEDYDPKYKKWQIEDLPILPEKVKYKVIDKTKSQLAVIKKCFNAHRNESFMLAADAEREGEVIGAEILLYAGFARYADAERFWVSEAMTKDVILAGMKNAKPLSAYESYKIQGFARQRADWLSGMNLSRYLTCRCNTLLPVGRVQSAVLGAIYEREKQIASFAREKYKEVEAVLKAETPFTVKLLNADNKAYPTRFSENNPLIKSALQACAVPNQGKILSVKKDTKTIAAPQLFNLTGLQKEAHTAFGLSPDKTLEIAQSLYETHKCLSYPRTPSVVMGDDNVELVKGIFDKLKCMYDEYAAGSLEGAIDRGNKRLFNTAELQDRRALLPLAPLPPSASADEKNVYFLVLKRFFNTLKPAYIYNAIAVAVDIAGYRFTGSGVEVLQKGWKKGLQNDEEKAQTLAGIEINDIYPVQKIEAVEKYTEPKKHFTYAALLQLMENPRNEEGRHLAGIGTPATRGAILQRLVFLQYISEKGKNILITDNGKFLIWVLLKNEALSAFISVPETTRWEEQLALDSARFVESIKAFVKTAVAAAINEKYENPGAAAIGKCPVCGKAVKEGKKAYYCEGYKEGCKFTIWKEIAHAGITRTFIGYFTFFCILFLSKPEKTNTA